MGLLNFIKWRIIDYKRIRNFRNVNSHNFVELKSMVSNDSVQIGNYSYGNLNISAMNRDCLVRIGSFCSIGPDVLFIACAEHDTTRISTYPFLNKLISGENEALSKGGIIIEDDVWVGQRAAIMSGVHIGQGAVVAAGAVVTKDVPPYAIVGGVPAKVIKYRFEPEMIEELLKVDYSKLTKEMIAEHIGDLYVELKDPKQLDWMPKKKVMIMEQIPKVSVCVLTYNPQKEKLMETLESIVKQKYGNLQIILSDDGSEESFFDAAREFLDNANITDYKLVEAPANQGTVKNVEQALLAADGVFIKTISPGDCLTEDTILSDWISHLMASGRQWSFSNAIYYSRKLDGLATVHKRPANPQLVDCYIRHDDDTCRWNYVVLDDLALGAAIVCERELMIRYIEQIVGAVKYAEDNVFRLMMFDGIVPDYFPKDALLYECDSGISTCGDSVWSQRVRADWVATDEHMLAQTDFGDELQKKMQATLRRKKGWSARKKRWLQYTEKGRIYKRFRYYWRRRLTGGNEGERLCR